MSKARGLSSGLLTPNWGSGLAGGNLNHFFDQSLFVLSISGMWTHLNWVRITEGREQQNKSSIGLPTCGPDECDCSYDRKEARLVCIDAQTGQYWIGVLHTSRM